MKLHALLIPVLTIALLGSCKKSDEDLTTQQMLDLEKPLSQIVEVKGLDSLYGKTYRGGFIAYVDTSDYHGFVVSVENIGSASSWGCYGQSELFTTGAEIGDGTANQASMIQHCTDPFNAAKACQAYQDGIFFDWYLPSEKELLMCFTNLHLKDKGNFTLDNYWTSTEGESSNSAKHILFIDGSVSSSSVGEAYFLRAIRNI